MQQGRSTCFFCLVVVISYLICLKIDENSSIDAVWDELISYGLEPLYSVEEERELAIYIKAEEGSSLKDLLKDCGGILSIGDPFPNETDWEAQWALHAPGFDGGHAVIDLEVFGGEGVIYLDPGAGFGDLSHPRELVQQGWLAFHFLVEDVPI